MDILIHFRTGEYRPALVWPVLIMRLSGYLEDGVLQTDSVKLRQHYINTTTFYIDLLCLLPLDFLYLSLDFQSMLRLCRLVKIYRFWEWLDRTERHTNYPNLFRLVSLMHYLLVAFHWNACIFYAIHKGTGFGSGNNTLFGQEYPDLASELRHREIIFALIKPHLATYLVKSWHLVKSICRRWQCNRVYARLHTKLTYNLYFTSHFLISSQNLISRSYGKFMSTFISPIKKWNKEMICKLVGWRYLDIISNSWQWDVRPGKAGQDAQCGQQWYQGGPGRCPAGHLQTVSHELLLDHPGHDHCRQPPPPNYQSPVRLCDLSVVRQV